MHPMGHTTHVQVNSFHEFCSVTLPMVISATLKRFLTSFNVFWYWEYIKKALTMPPLKEEVTKHQVTWGGWQRKRRGHHHQHAEDSDEEVHRSFIDELQYSNEERALNSPITKSNDKFTGIRNHDE